MAQHDPLLVEGNVIAVDFKRKRRLGLAHATEVKITSFTQDHCGTIPRSFRLEDQLILVWEVLDRWPGRDYRYVKVRSVDDVIYFLRHDMKSNRWTIID